MPEVAGILGFGGLPQAGGPYREVADLPSNAVDRWLERRLGWFMARMPFVRRRLSRRADRILALAPEVAALDDEAIVNAALQLRPRLLARRSDTAAVDRAFALVREMAGRRLGKRHYKVQLMGALALFEGRLVEMATGEGKTLTAAPAAIVAALAGDPVHVVTVNDYLAARDAADLEPLYTAFGLTVGVIDSEMDEAARRTAYGCDITYVSNKNLTFDYLRDRVALRGRRARARRRVAELAGGAAAGRLILRGLAFAIVDEADSVFIDEARTPLILSVSTDDPAEARIHAEALDFARTLAAPRDYTLDAMNRQVTLTEAGKARATAALAGRGGLWRVRRAREDLVVQALSALHLYEAGRDYVVIDGTVQIVDEYTGRVMPDRSWQGGLHQLIETKEGVAVTGRKETLARITYQRFFRRYARLSGMTGTGMELAGEFRETYGLTVVRIPPNRPCRRRHLWTTVLRTEDQKWAALARRVADLHEDGVPVLIGTRSVEASERASAALAARGLPHAVLNARQDKGEAAIIAAAGQKGAITVATNMAGRGTDIALGPGVAELGGLHVILTEFHESARIDRQLYGRAGRQGEPGATEALVSLEDELFTRYAPRIARLARILPVAGLARRVAQARAEAEHAATRAEQTLLDRQLERAMAFAGPVE
jgi:preprotein translocase subunit SecA